MEIIPSRNKKVVAVCCFRPPKDEKLKKKLLKEVKICHQHFEESCFKHDLEVIYYYLHFIIDYPLNRTFSQRFSIPHNEESSLIFSAQTS